MTSRRQLSLILGFVVLTALVLFGAMKPADADSVCGPGPHWVDSCLADTDNFYSTAAIGVDLDFDGFVDIPAVLSGPTTIFRGFPFDTPDPLDPGHFNQINTEIVSMNLIGSGMTLTAGDGIGNLGSDGSLYSPGAVVEQPGDPTQAESFFDVFFQIQTPLGLLHNNDPARMAAVIDRVPPGTTYRYFGPPILLFDEYGIPRAQLIHGEHTVVPYEIYWKDYNGEDFGGYMPDIDQNQDFDKAQWVRHEENDPQVLCGTNWLPYSDDYASGGSIKYSDTTWDSCSFTFTGTSIRYIATPSNNKGIAEVYIDGQYQRDVDLYSLNLEWQQALYTNNNLTPGEHTISILVTGRKNPSSSLPRIDVDAFDVAVGNPGNESHYCAPVAEANSLWWLDKKYENIVIFANPFQGTGYIGGDWNGDGVADILDLVRELAWYMDTNGQRTGIPHTGTTVEDEQNGIHDFLSYIRGYGLDNRLYEHTAWDSDFPDWMLFFHFLEEEVERCQDVKLDLGFWHVDEAFQIGPNLWQITWSRRGGHAVTVAGVDSQNFLFAISDPDNDAAEGGAPGVVRPLPGAHPAHPDDPTIHNNEMFASHDIYQVGPSPSPGGKIGVLSFPWKWNLPEGEWRIIGPVTVEWTEPLYESMTFTEIEAAVIVSPIICGNGHIDPGEECDDGNTNNGDGCSSTCKWEPDIAVNPTSWDFGNVVVGGSSTKTITISNTGGGNLVISSIAMTGGNAGMFSVATGGSNPCPNLTPTIAPGGNCTINTKFSPTSLGAKSTTMRISSNDPNENPLNVPLNGKGPRVVLTSPNFEEILYSGTKWTITWKVYETSRPVAKVKLFLTKNGINWEKIATLTPLPPRDEVIDEFYTWTVPSVVTKKTQCKVKVVLLDAGGVSLGKDTSDEFFTIKKEP